MRRFEWWQRVDGKVRIGVPRGLAVYHELPFTHQRTDILATIASESDVYLVNLLATLLVHSQHCGYWGELGRRFEHEAMDLLIEHQLTGLLDAYWVRTDESENDTDDTFFAALQELVAAAADDCKRENRMRFDIARGIRRDYQPGLLASAYQLVRKYYELLLQHASDISKKRRST